jgi:hypothetical protein
MKPTDIRVIDAEVRFTTLKLLPFRLSTGSSPEATYASVRITAENRAGQVGVGCGGILLSALWAYPGSELTEDEKDRAMRSVVLGLKDRLLNYDRAGPQHFLSASGSLG